MLAAIACARDRDVHVFLEASEAMSRYMTSAPVERGILGRALPDGDSPEDLRAKGVSARGRKMR